MCTVVYIIKIHLYQSIDVFLQCCYSLIDSLLEGTELTGNITQAVDIILCPDVSFLQVHCIASKYKSIINSAEGLEHLYLGLNVYKCIAKCCFWIFLPLDGFSFSFSYSACKPLLIHTAFIS